MTDHRAPKIYSIAAHRGFADALVAGLAPRYADGDLGLARLTLLLPSTRAVRTITEAFIRLYGTAGLRGMLMPRMAVIGDLDLDETLGTLLDPLGATQIPPAVDPTRRLLRLTDLLAEELGQEHELSQEPNHNPGHGRSDTVPGSAMLFRRAREMASTMDRLLVEDIGPERLLHDDILDLLGDLSGHWQNSLRLFARIQTRWLAELAQMGAIDSSSRRNRLFDHAAQTWRGDPPSTPIVAAGVTSASPSLARLLKVVSQLPQGAVILPDFDLSMGDHVWAELSAAGETGRTDQSPFQGGDAVTHPQYHLKLLLNRMGIARGEVQQWHRKGMTAASPDRTHAISNLFLPPEASKNWVNLPADQRRLNAVRIMETANPEQEAQAIALLVRQALTQPEKRVAVITPDRGLAQRVVQHLRRWHIQVDDTAGRPLSQTPAGRAFLLMAETAVEQAAPVPLLALLQHPLVHGGLQRGTWLTQARRFELALRGPRLLPGLEPLGVVARKAGVAEWWESASQHLVPLLDMPERCPLADALDRLVTAGQQFCGDDLWAQEDGRALSAFIQDLRYHSGETGTCIDAAALHGVLRDAMEAVAVRPPYGAHPRVAIYGLLESRMSRADLTICAGLNEGSWPASTGADPLLAPPVLRALGVPGADFRIGLSAHDMAAALGAPEVVLSRAERDVSGPTIASRFLLRVKALLGADLIARHREYAIVATAANIDAAPPAERYTRPAPSPTPEQRRTRISVTALDRLRSDPYQFYAGSILRLKERDALDAAPSAAWKGTVAHQILETWHRSQRPLADVAQEVLRQMNAHPLMRALWQPRLTKALEWVECTIATDQDRTPVLFEEWGTTRFGGIEIFGKADRIDRLADGTLAIVDYKTGAAPTNKEVAAGYALQLGTIGLMARDGAFETLRGTATVFEYWSLAKSRISDTGFGAIHTPLGQGRNKGSVLPEDFLSKAEGYLHDALDNWILGDAPFTARLNPDAKVYTTYDQLMRLEEWMGRET